MMRTTQTIQTPNSEYDDPEYTNDEDDTDDGEYDDDDDDDDDYDDDDDDDDDGFPKWQCHCIVTLTHPVVP